MAGFLARGRVSWAARSPSLEFSIIVVSLLAACDASRGGSLVPPLALAPEPPAPFALQYAGVYLPDDASSFLTEIDLLPTGSFRMTCRGGSPCDDGVWSADAETRALPLEVRLLTESGAGSLVIDTYDGEATVRYETTPIPLPSFADRWPQQSACDASGGDWTDDDPDSRGLYCVCHDGAAYVPSAGGCIFLGAAGDGG